LQHFFKFKCPVSGAKRVISSIQNKRESCNIFLRWFLQQLLIWLKG